MCLSKERWEWIYDVVESAMLNGDFKYCDKCPMRNINCNSRFCDETRRQIRLCLISAKKE